MKLFKLMMLVQNDQIYKILYEYSFINQLRFETFQNISDENMIIF